MAVGFVAVVTAMTKMMGMTTVAMLRMTAMMKIQKTTTMNLSFLFQTRMIGRKKVSIFFLFAGK